MENGDEITEKVKLYFRDTKLAKFMAVGLILLQFLLRTKFKGVTQVQLQVQDCCKA